MMGMDSVTLLIAVGIFLLGYLFGKVAGMRH